MSRFSPKAVAAPLGLLMALSLGACSSDEETAPLAPATSEPAPEVKPDAPDPVAEPSPTPPPPSRVPEAVEAMGELKSLHIAGALTEAKGVTHVSFRLFAEGPCAGEVRGAAIGGGHMNFRLTPAGAFVRGDRAFWDFQAGAQGLRVTSVLNGRWVKVPPARLGSYPRFCSLPTLLDKLARMGRVFPATAVAEPQTIEGKPAWVYSAKRDRLALMGGPNPRIVALERTGEYALHFSKFNEGTVPSPPPAENVVPLALIQASG